MREAEYNAQERTTCPQDGEVYLRRGTEFHCVVAAEHQIMGLEGAFRHHLTNFLEINLRCNA
jgi:hypothetical protein